MNQNKIVLAVLICFGIFSVIISYLGFFIWGWVGILGVFKVFFDLFYILEGHHSLKVNLYPLTGIFIVPIFYMLIFQFLNYIRMIYLGVNQKTEMSIIRFKNTGKGKFEHQISFKIGIIRILKFFWWKNIPKSELRREMTVDAKLEYELPSGGLRNSEVQRFSNISRNSF